MRLDDSAAWGTDVVGPSVDRVGRWAMRQVGSPWKARHESAATVRTRRGRRIDGHRIPITGRGGAGVPLSGGGSWVGVRIGQRWPRVGRIRGHTEELLGAPQAGGDVGRGEETVVADIEELAWEDVEQESTVRGRQAPLSIYGLRPPGWRDTMMSHMANEPESPARLGAPVPAVANLGLLRPPLIYLAAIALGLVVHLIWPAPLIPQVLGAPLGSLVVLGAVALFVSGVRTFRAAGTPVPGNRPTTRIVCTGPYRFTRNPIYLAFTLFQLGLALWVNSLGVIISLILAVCLMSFVVVPREERYLEGRFPSEYPAYKASVRRWL
jgi:protein-S-isoprenylcysteine O-methyltransferase Ste14